MRGREQRDRALGANTTTSSSRRPRAPLAELAPSSPPSGCARARLDRARRISCSKLAGRALAAATARWRGRQKSATSKLLGRARFGSMPQLCSSAPRSGVTGKALAQHLAALAEGSAVTRSSVCDVAAGLRGLLGTSSTIDEVTLGGGVKARGANVEQNARRPCAIGDHREAAVGLAAGRGDDALRHLALEHQRQRSNQGGQGSVLSQPISSGVATL